MHRTTLLLILAGVLIVGAVTVVVIADHATAGERLFPVDQWWESVRLALTPGDDARVRYQFAIFQERLDEVWELYQQGVRGERSELAWGLALDAGKDVEAAMKAEGVSQSVIDEIRNAPVDRRFAELTNTAPDLIGGDRDAHGCLIPGGYSWCDAKSKCLRTWEEPCVDESAWYVYRSDVMELTLRHPADVEIAEEPGNLYLALGEVTFFETGATNAFLRITGNTAYYAEDNARLVGPEGDTYLIDDASYPATTGRDAGRYEGDSAGTVRNIAYDRYVIHIEQYPGNTRPSQDVLALADQILATLRAGMTTPPGDIGMSVTMVVGNAESYDGRTLCIKDAYQSSFEFSAMGPSLRTLDGGSRTLEKPWVWIASGPDDALLTCTGDGKYTGSCTADEITLCGTFRYATPTETGFGHVGAYRYELD